MEGVGRISLALATLTEDPGEEDRIDEGNLFSFYCTHVLYQKRTKDEPANKFSFFVL